jgi:hypothetical protein
MRQRTEVVRPKGINKDLSPYELPMEVWSDGLNIDFRRHRTSKAAGWANTFTATLGTPPAFHIYFTDNIDTYWAYASETEIWKTQGTTTELLGSGYNASREFRWNGCNFNSLIVMNNALDHPQVLEPDNKDSMIDLPNWGYPLIDPPIGEADIWDTASRCKVIRPYKNYLMAMDCSDQNGTRYPSMIRWSSPAILGDVPPSWDPGLVGEQAGLYTLADSPGRIVDGQTLGDYFLIYKTDAVWISQFIGGDFIFSFRKLFGDEAGCLGTNCVAEYDGKHFILSTTGAYVHNGATKEDIMDPWIKDEFFGKVAEERILETKVVADHDNKEIWVYYTTAEAYADNVDVYANRAVIWNREIKERTIRYKTNKSHIAQGIIETTGLVTDDCDTYTESWDSDVTIWNSDSPLNPTLRNLLLADYAASEFYVYESDIKVEGEEVLGWVQRIGMDFGDDRMFKYVTRIVPHVLGQNPITVKVFVEDSQTGVPTQVHSTEFDPRVDHDIDCHAVGRYIGVQFEGINAWTLTGYTIEWEPAGTF